MISLIQDDLVNFIHAYIFSFGFNGILLKVLSMSLSSPMTGDFNAKNRNNFLQANGNFALRSDTKKNV